MNEATTTASRSTSVGGAGFAPAIRPAAETAGVNPAPPTTPPPAIAAPWLLYSALAAAIVGSVAISLRYGAHPLSWSDLGQLWFDVTGATVPRATVSSLVYDIRLPRILAALAIGAGLSVAGASYQGLFRNSLVSPDILGASSGAAFGAALGIMLAWSVLGIQGLAFGSGLGAVALTYGLSRGVGGGTFTLKLVLTGMVVGSLGMAGVAVIKTLADPYSKLPLITYWLLGSLSSVTALDVKLLLPPLVVGVVVLLALRWPLNVMALGEDEARALGVPTGTVRLLTLLSATLVTAVAVAVAGVIGWVGLMVPHLVRFMIGPNHRDLLPAALLLGAIFLLWADNLARWIFVVELPLGVVTCACGIPIFLVLLRRAARSWND
ncbi:MAG: iron ABC transporter permease [Opitutaceae bacterium]|nr:iron ABC transporter permease [Opitutaceae bacterium]